MKIKILMLLICLALLLTGCNTGKISGMDDNRVNSDNNEAGPQGELTDLGDDNKTFGEDIQNSGVYDGYFEGESTDIANTLTLFTTTNIINNTIAIIFFITNCPSYCIVYLICSSVIDGLTVTL